MAIRLTEFFQRRPGMSAEAFLSHWQEQHTGVVSAIEGLRRYVQNPAAGLAAGAATPYDGMVEAWFDDLGAIEAIQKSDYWDTIVEDELRFVDRPSLRLFLSEEPLPPRAEPGWKHVRLLHRLEGQTPEAFRDALRGAEPISADLPGLWSVERVLPLPVARSGAEPCADALEIWRFESQAALESGAKSEGLAQACNARARWARAEEPLHTKERVIR